MIADWILHYVKAKGDRQYAGYFVQVLIILIAFAFLINLGFSLNQGLVKNSWKLID